MIVGHNLAMNLLRAGRNVSVTAQTLQTLKGPTFSAATVSAPVKSMPMTERS